MSPVLSLRGLSVTFRTGSGPVEAVSQVDLDLSGGETVAVVGESGSGKSTLAGAVLKLLPENGSVTAGTAHLGDLDLVTTSERRMTAVRGARIGYVPQDPMTNLDPVHTVGAQIAEALEVHGRATGERALQQAVDLLDRAGIDDAASRARQYPHEFSGGMRQRALIAMALACRPEVLVADEPTSALDVTVQRRVLDQMAELTADLGTAVLLITHDLALAAERADRVVVMHRGRVVESGPSAQVLSAPTQDYTKRLLDAAPAVAIARGRGVPAPPADETPDVVLELQEVSRSYRLRGRSEPLRAVDAVSLEVRRGRTLAVVGESGSGKSTTGRLALRLEDADAGAVRFDGDDVGSRNGRALKGFRRAVQPVFQNPYASLDPRFTVAQVVAEPLRAHRLGDRTARRRRVAELLEQVALPADFADRYPHELSGGQRQRVAIARALAPGPRVVVLDEAVSALDVLVQQQVLDLLLELQRDLGLAYLFITHDLAVVRLVAHEVVVLQSGRVVERGTPQRVLESPQEQYTADLVAAIPSPSGLV